MDPTVVQGRRVKIDRSMGTTGRRTRLSLARLHNAARSRDAEEAWRAGIAASQDPELVRHALEQPQELSQRHLPVCELPAALVVCSEESGDLARIVLLRTGVSLPATQPPRSCAEREST